MQPLEAIRRLEVAPGEVLVKILNQGLQPKLNAVRSRTATRPAACLGFGGLGSDSSDVQAPHHFQSASDATGLYTEPVTRYSTRWDAWRPQTLSLSRLRYDRLFQAYSLGPSFSSEGWPSSPDGALAARHIPKAPKQCLGS